MKEIIFHGRGGQGAVIASRLLAMAAFKEGKDVQSFPFFGVERRGAPVTAYTRFSGSKIRKREPIAAPDYVIVFDSALIGSIDVTGGLKAGGAILINSKASPDSFLFRKGFSVFTFDASAVASKYKLGSQSAPIVNTALLGAFSKVTKEVRIGSIIESIKENMATKADDNINAAREAYERAG